MSEHPLLDLIETRSRATDPDTSREAARAARPRAKTDAAKILRYLETSAEEPLTSAEIADALGMERHAAARRLPDLARLGCVQRLPARTCRTNGRSAVTWWAITPTEEGEPT